MAPRDVHRDVQRYIEDAPLPGRFDAVGAGTPSTILGGVRDLVSSGMYPLAALVFFASVAVPTLKLVGLTVMLVATQTGQAGWLRDRTRLAMHRAVDRALWFRQVAGHVDVGEPPIRCDVQGPA